MRIDTLIVNKGEAGELFGDASVNPCLWARRLAAHGLDRMVITRGAEPTLAIWGEGIVSIPTLRVEPVDTVGAGDAFAGTCAARLAAGDRFSDAVLSANAAGALATLKPGAQEAMPTRRATERALRR